MSTIGEKLQASKDGLDALLEYANGVTGKEDANIGDAIKTLTDGYSQAPGAAIFDITPQEDTLIINFDGLYSASYFLFCAAKSKVTGAGVNNRLRTVAKMHINTYMLSSYLAGSIISISADGKDDSWNMYENRFTISKNGTKLQLNTNSTHFAAGITYTILYIPII